MICPQTKAECDCSAMNFPICQPPPTLAEIKKLAVAYGNACSNYVGFGHGSPKAGLAALMAAIRLYGRE